MTLFAHTSVLAAETIAYLEPRPGRVYCDGTLGGGGHAAAILERSAPDGRLIGIDRDQQAVDAARERLAGFGERATLVHGCFGDMDRILADLGVAEVHGIVLDLGTSSPQIDQAARGFSFQQEGPIDMRMDPTAGETALELLRRLGPEEIATILFAYGEEKYSRRIAERIKDALARRALTTTTELAALVEAAIPADRRRQMKIHPATRTFQALRIAVNAELDELARFLAFFPALLAAGGRCVVISFHSLEDRMVKHRFRDLARTSSLPPDLARRAGEPTEPVCTTITRKPVLAGEDEVRDNPRSRSAKLRACEKVAA